jgi:hypothetical protein
MMRLIYGSVVLVFTVFMMSSPAMASICKAMVVQPQEPGVESYFDAIAGTGPTDLWAAGAFRPHGGQYQALVEHFDGANWTVVPAPTENYVNLTSAAAFSATDVWAVGSKGDKVGNIEFFAIRWNGSIWSEVEVPTLGGTDEELNAVAVDPGQENDVWVLGSSTSHYAHAPTYQVAWHHNRGGWKLYSWRSPGFGLAGISISASGQAWAVGEMTGRKPFVYHWNGQVWESQPAPFRNTSGLQAVNVIDDTDVWAVGFAGDHPLTERFDGQSWSIHQNPNPGVRSALVSVSGSSATDVWATGYEYVAGTVFKSLSDHWISHWRSTVSRNPGTSSVLDGVKALGSYQAMSVGEYRGAHGLRHPLSVIQSCL